MGERERYTPGTFCWADLGTDDAAAAKGFYTGLFGWDAEDMPMGDQGVYTMFMLEGRRVCALYGRQVGEGPPAWLSYVSVDDAKTVTAAARAAGAQVIHDPIDVFDAGRMAVLQDPTGAVFAVWQPGDNIGATVVNEPNALTLNQLNTSIPEQAGEFYRRLFGWRIESVGTAEQPYWGIYNGPGLNGGMMPLPSQAAAPSHWLVYFGTADIEVAAARITELGGHVLMPPMPVPGGQVLVAADPQGATFALFEGRFDP